MSLLWIDGFDSYGTSLGGLVSPTTVLAQRYPAAGISNYHRIQAGLWSGYCLSMGDSRTLTTPSINTHATIVAGFWFKSLATSGSHLVLSMRDGSSVNAALYVDVTNSTIIVQTAGTTRATVAIASPMSWLFIELKVTVADSGSWELRVGGVTLASGSHDTKVGTNNYCDTVRLHGAGGPVYQQFDHYYICNGDTTAPNNFLGPVKVATIRPDGDTASADWTPQSGSDHFAMVDEAAMDSDTTYMESSTTDATDLWDYSALSGVGATIHGLQVVTECKETDAQAFALKSVIKSGTTVDESASIAISSADYIAQSRISVTDPDTATAWTEAGVNAAQFGVKVG